jgi:hypothetical protein
VGKHKYILFQYYPIGAVKLDGFYDDQDVNHNVYISKSLKGMDREIAFAHENEHRECHIQECFCWSSGTEFWSEYHAFKAEFDFVVEQNKDKWWKVYFEYVIRNLKKYKRVGRGAMSTWPDHFRALSKVCRLNEFGEYARGYGYYDRIMAIVERGMIHNVNSKSD